MAHAKSPLKASHYPNSVTENHDPNLGSRNVISQDERSGGIVLHEINGIVNSSSPRENGTKFFTPPHRHHSKSPRCAANTPDYAVPATVPPRKLLVSKRHQAGFDFSEQKSDFGAGSSIMVRAASGYENMKHGDEEMNHGPVSHVEQSDIRVHNLEMDAEIHGNLNCCSRLIASPCSVPLIPNCQDQDLQTAMTNLANEEKCMENSEEKGYLQEQSQGRRACGTRVQSLVQAFESMISLAEGRKIQSCGEQSICSRKYQCQSISVSGMIACHSETNDDGVSNLQVPSGTSKIGAWNTGLVLHGNHAEALEDEKIGEAQIIPTSAATESAVCGTKEEPSEPGKILDCIKESEQGEDQQSESTTSYESEIEDTLFILSKASSPVSCEIASEFSEIASCASYEFHSGVAGSIPQKRARATCLQPFALRTQARGAQKEYEFRKKLEKMMAEDRQLRVPVAQGLPWTTDQPEIVPKPPVKESTVPMELRLYTEYRSAQRAQFDEYVAAKLMYIEEQRQEQQRLQELAEEEEVKRLRKQMVPRAQLMPYFDRPFIPRRCSKRLTIPKEPSFHASHDHKRAKCMASHADR